MQAANDRFEATMTNVVRWEATAEGQLLLQSDTEIQVRFQLDFTMLLNAIT